LLTWTARPASRIELPVCGETETLSPESDLDVEMPTIPAPAIWITAGICSAPSRTHGTLTTRLTRAQVESDEDDEHPSRVEPQKSPAKGIFLGRKGEVEVDGRGKGDWRAGDEEELDDEDVGLKGGYIS
jgi:hypothetical protein